MAGHDVHVLSILMTFLFYDSKGNNDKLNLFNVGTVFEIYAHLKTYIF